MTDATVPAEHVQPGIALQRVNVYNLDGTYNRPVAYNGTEEEARLYARLLVLHDTHPEHATVLAGLTQLRNERRALDQR